MQLGFLTDAKTFSLLCCHLLTSKPFAFLTTSSRLEQTSTLLQILGSFDVLFLDMLMYNESKYDCGIDLDLYWTVVAVYIFSFLTQASFMHL